MSGYIYRLLMIGYNNVLVDRSNLFFPIYTARLCTKKTFSTHRTEI